MSNQVVVVEDEYGVRVYHDKETDVILFELRQYEDSLPTKHDLQMLARQIDKITDPLVKNELLNWYNENYTDWDEETRLAIERNKVRRSKDTQNMVESLVSEGYTVTKDTNGNE